MSLKDLITFLNWKKCRFKKNIIEIITMANRIKYLRLVSPIIT